jgi:hypothetical protein
LKQLATRTQLLSQHVKDALHSLVVAKTQPLQHQMLPLLQQLPLRRSSPWRFGALRTKNEEEVHRHFLLSVSPIQDQNTKERVTT